MVRCDTRSSMVSQNSVRSSWVGSTGSPAHFGSVNTEPSPSSSSIALNSRGWVCANCSQIPSLVGAVSSG